MSKKAGYELKTISNKLKVVGKMTGDSLTLRKGDEVTFAAEYGEHKWSEDEITKLLNGEEVGYADKYGEVVKGVLGKQKFFGNSFVGFTKSADNLQMLQEFIVDVNDGKFKDKDVDYKIKNDKHGRPKVYLNWFHKNKENEISFAAVYKDHKWSDAEIKDLLAGKGVNVLDVDEDGNSKMVSAHLDVQRYMSKYFVGVKRDYVKEAELDHAAEEAADKSVDDEATEQTAEDTPAVSVPEFDDIVIRDPQDDGPEVS